MKKYYERIIVLLLILISIGITTYTYSSEILSIFNDGIEEERITINSQEAIVFSFSKQIENITFSKDSGFTIRTLEGGVWKDVSNDVSDYSPMNGYIIRNFSEGDLIIESTYKNIDSIENSIFQKTLKAGWNLIGVAHKDDEGGVLTTSDALGEFLPYSQVLDFTGNGFDETVTMNTYSGEAQILNTNPNHNINNDLYQILSKSELSNAHMLEKLAYAVFVNNDTVISGSQKLTADETNLDDGLGDLLGTNRFHISYPMIFAMNDFFDQVDTNYTGTVNINFTSQITGTASGNELSDGTYTFQTSDNGSLNLSEYFTYDEIGIYGISVNDVGNNIFSTGSFNIKPTETILSLDSIEVSSGTTDIVAAKINIENSIYNDFTLNQIGVKVCEVVIDGNDCTNNGDIIEVKLYKNEVSTGTLIGQTNILDSNSKATFDINDIITNNSNTTYIATITPNYNNDIIGKEYNTYFTGKEYNNSYGIINFDNLFDDLLGDLLTDNGTITIVENLDDLLGDLTDDVTVTLSSTTINNDILVLGNGVETIAYKGEINVGTGSGITVNDFNFIKNSTSSINENLNDIVDSAELIIGSNSFSGNININSIDFITNLSIDSETNNEIVLNVTLKDNDTILNHQILILEVDNNNLDIEDSNSNSVENLDITDINTNLTNIELLSKGDFWISLLNNYSLTDNILAGSNNVTIGELELHAISEDVKINELILYINGDDFSTTLENVRLVDDSSIISNNAIVTFDGTNTLIIFENDFIIEETTNGIEVELVADFNRITGELGETSGIEGYFYINSITPGDIDISGIVSNDNITATTINSDNGEMIYVVSTIITPSITDTLNNNESAKIRIYSNAGTNVDSNGESIKTEIEFINLSYLGTTDQDNSLVFQLININDPSDIITGEKEEFEGEKLIWFDLNNMISDNNYTINDNNYETFEILISGQTIDQDIVNLKLVPYGISYYAKDSFFLILSDNEQEIDLGSKSY